MKKLSKVEMKKVVGGGNESEAVGFFGTCTVDCTGCPAYTCSSGCDSMENGASVTCDGIKHECRKYPSCWS